MDFNEDISTIAIELPASWRNMIFCMLAYSVGAWIVYLAVLWRYAALERKSKIWFSALYTALFVVCNATIFVENIFY